LRLNEPAKGHSPNDAYHDSRRNNVRCLAQNQAQHIGWQRAKRHADADLVGSARDAVTGSVPG